MDAMGGAVRTLVIALALVGCRYSPVPGAESREEALRSGEVEESCVGTMLRQYAECTRLDCEANPLVPHGFDVLCERNCQEEATLAYRECVDAAAALADQTAPQGLEVRAYLEAEQRIEAHAGPVLETCLTCLR